MSKSTWLAAIVFVALLAAAVLTLRDRPERGITRISFSDVEPSEVTRVVGTGRHPFELVRRGEDWALADGRPASATTVGRLIDAVPQIASSTVVTNDDSRFEELEVDEGSGTAILVEAGPREVARFVVGKDGRNGAYVRVDDAVYATRGVWQSLFRRDASGWIEKKIFPQPLADVERVAVTRADGTAYVLLKREDNWALEDQSALPAGFRFDGKEAASLARSLVGLRAADVLAEDPGSETSGLDGAVDVYRLAAADAAVELTLGATVDDGSRYARASGWDQIFVVPAATVARLEKSPTDFRDLTLMRIDPDTATRLDIRDGDRELSFVRATTDAAWTLDRSTEDTPEGFTLDPAKVQARVAALANARAAGPAPASGTSPQAPPPAPGDDAAADGPRATASVSITNQDGTPTALVFFEGVDDESVLARGNADAQTYLAPTFLRSQLTDGLESFARTTAPTGRPQLDPAALQNLPPDVRRQLLEQMAAPRQGAVR